MISLKIKLKQKTINSILLIIFLGLFVSTSVSIVDDAEKSSDNEINRLDSIHEEDFFYTCKDSGCAVPDNNSGGNG